MMNIFESSLTQDEYTPKTLEEALLRLKKLSSVLENIHDGVYIGDHHGITDVNRVGIEMLGFDTPDDLKKNIQKLSLQIQNSDPLTGKQLTLEEEPFIRALNGETVVKDISVLHLKTKERRIVRCAATPIRANGIVVAAVAVNTDITEQKQIESKLIESEARYRFIALSTSQSVWDWDLQTGRVLRNQGLQHSFGYESKEVEEPNWWAEHIHKDDRERVLNDLQTALASGQDHWKADYRFLKKDNSYARIIDRGFIIRNNEGDALRALGSMIDDSGRFQAEEERTILLKLSSSDLVKLRQERELREQFVSTLTHDLRTPLTAAKMSAELLKRKSGDVEKVKTLVNRVISDIDRADSMIRDLLDTNQIQAGQRLALKITPCNMLDITRDTLVDMKTVHGDRFLLKSHKVVEGFWDANQVRRIIENLCGNAVKYGSPNEPITVSITELESEVQVSVHNLGNPIPTEEQETLFRAFHRTSTATKSGQKGWGLGLTLVRGTAEAHGGTVSVKSSAEAGTTFTLVIPKDSRPFQ
jgi:PAS domain S-box-containing protein